MDDVAMAAVDVPFRLVNWALLWSPLSDSEAMQAAWDNLQLPVPLADSLRHAFVKTFQMDLPQPVMPLVFSAGLQRDSGACHEEWMRISSHLGLSRVGPVLPPDHLSLACELLAHAWMQQDAVLVKGMMERYFMPWLELAIERSGAELSEAILVPFRQHMLDMSVPQTH